MPIDLKWVRDNAEAVKEWQRLRGLNADHVVQQVLDADEASRVRLSELQEVQRKLADVKRHLKPNQRSFDEDKSGDHLTTESKSREKWLEEKLRLESEILMLDELWRESLQKAEKSSWKLASPLDIVKDQPSTEQGNQSFLQCEDIVPKSAHSALSEVGMDLQNAWKQHTMQYFADFPAVQICSGLQVERSKNSQKCGEIPGCLDPERAHAIWGCKEMDDGNFSGTCAICRVQKVDGAYAVLPAWIRLLTEFLPAKSIWGDKQLPVYAAVWNDADCSSVKDVLEKHSEPSCLRTESAGSSFSLDLVALTPSSFVDARQVQTDIVEKITRYYGNLLVPFAGGENDSSRIVTSYSQPHELERHECSCVKILAKGIRRDELLCLGKVSCWGDAASRACAMSFAGGGLRSVKGRIGPKSQIKKEFVYVVQASVVDSCTWEKLIFANSVSCKDQNAEALLGIPPVLRPHLVHPIDTKRRAAPPFQREDVFVLLDSLTIDLSAKKLKQPQIFRPLNKILDPTAFDVSTAETGPPSEPSAKFPLIRKPEDSLSREQYPSELGAISCPFEFLFDSR
jgi:hypothetical protein